MASHINIDRCVCFEVPFCQLREIAERTGARTIEELQAYRTFGMRCRLCHPYVRRMLRTGETAFDSLIVDDE